MDLAAPLLKKEEGNPLKQACQSRLQSTKKIKHRDSYTQRSHLAAKRCGLYDLAAFKFPESNFKQYTTGNPHHLKGPVKRLATLPLCEKAWLLRLPLCEKARTLLRKLECTVANRNRRYRLEQGRCQPPVKSQQPSLCNNGPATV